MIRVVCSDTGPVLHLKEIGGLDLLGKTGSVIVPPAVDLELRELAPDWSDQKPYWVAVHSLEASFVDQAERWVASGLLHSGEAEALALAVQLSSEWYLTDDAAARIMGLSLGIEVHGTLGVLLWCVAKDIVDGPAAQVMLDALEHSSMWISPAVMSEARAALDKLSE
jgi:predicted nucleic acid-binding protein